MDNSRREDNGGPLPYGHRRNQDQRQEPSSFHRRSSPARDFRSPPSGSSNEDRDSYPPRRFMGGRGQRGPRRSGGGGGARGRKRPISGNDDIGSAEWDVDGSHMSALNRLGPKVTVSHRLGGKVDDEEREMAGAESSGLGSSSSHTEMMDDSDNRYGSFTLNISVKSCIAAVKTFQGIRLSRTK